jgi:hypothetical protein
VLLLDPVLDLPIKRRIDVPLLVLGAASARCFLAFTVRATARAQGTEPEFFPDVGHDMMLEPGWAAVAERIHRWLVDRGL